MEDRSSANKKLVDEVLDPGCCGRMGLASLINFVTDREIAPTGWPGKEHRRFGRYRN